MSGGFGAGLATAVDDEAVDNVDCAVAGRDPGATLSGRAGVEGCGAMRRLGWNESIGEVFPVYPSAIESVACIFRAVRDVMGESLRLEVDVEDKVGMMDAAHSSTLTAAQAPPRVAPASARCRGVESKRRRAGFPWRAGGVEAEFDCACAHRRSHGSAAPPPTMTFLLWSAATEMMVSTTPSETR